MTEHVVSSRQTFHQFAAGLHAQPKAVGLVHHLLAGLQSFIPSDYNSWKEITLHNGQAHITGVFSPHNPKAASLLPVFQRRVGEHPVCSHWLQSGKSNGAFSWSDVASRQDIERLPLYDEFYRPLGIHHQMMIALEAKPSHLIYLAMNRSRSAFTEQERHLLGSLQPHASQALRHMREMHRLQSTLSSFETLVDTLNQGIVCLSSHNRIKWASKRGRMYLQTYFGAALHSAHLPDALHAWLLTQHMAAGTDRPVQGPLTIQRGTNRLTIRLLTEKNERYVFMEEISIQPSFNELKRLGLTEREAHVLGWVAQGKSNEDTAMILKMGPQTVKKHLERIYSALRVANRTEAALKAHEILRRKPEG